LVNLLEIVYGNVDRAARMHTSCSIGISMLILDFDNKHTRMRILDADMAIRMDASP
jgi:hypothetical protein